ncbi:MAG: Tat pathway signal protein, partial [Haloferacaceae archaeon]|nr:Tat pathway signal protein [Haloferacaceae archaeon]
MLYADLRGATDLERVRERIDGALHALTDAYRWGPSGLLFTVGYSPAYFRRFYGRGPSGVDLPPPRRLSPFETPTFDQHDLVIHLASDRADAVTGAEAALLGEQELVNGLEVPAAVDDLLDRVDRRTGFVGEGMPAERQGELVGIPEGDPVPDAAPLFMGFMTGFRQNQATESAVEITSGPFEGGTTLHLANIRLSLDAWYTENSHAEQVAKLFSPTHAGEDAVPGVGRALGDDNGITPAIIERIDTDAETVGV